MSHKDQGHSRRFERPKNHREKDQVFQSDASLYEKEIRKMDQRLNDGNISNKNNHQNKTKDLSFIDDTVWHHLCLRPNVIGTSFQESVDFISKIEKIKSNHVFYIETRSRNNEKQSSPNENNNIHDNNSNHHLNSLMNINDKCRPQLSKYRHGAQAYPELMAFLVADALNLSAPIACTTPISLNADVLGNQLDPRCQFKDPHTGEYRVLGIVMAHVPGLVSGTELTAPELVPFLDPKQSKEIFRRSKNQKKKKIKNEIVERSSFIKYNKVTESERDDSMREQLRDLSDIMVLDYLVQNTDRYHPKNVFYSNVIDRYIALDNGYLMGHAPLCRNISSLIEHPPLISILDRQFIDPSQNDSPYQNSILNYELCAFSNQTRYQLVHNMKIAMNRIRFLYLNNKLVLSLSNVKRRWRQHLGQKRELESAFVLQRNINNCSSRLLSGDGFQAFKYLVQGIEARMNFLLSRIEICQQKYGNQFL